MGSARAGGYVELVFRPISLSICKVLFCFFVCVCTYVRTYVRWEIEGGGGGGSDAKCKYKYQFSFFTGRTFFSRSVEEEEGEERSHFICIRIPCPQPNQTLLLTWVRYITIHIRIHMQSRLLRTLH